jgi:hypothetical protein
LLIYFTASVRTIIFVSPIHILRMKNLLIAILFFTAACFTVFSCKKKTRTVDSCDLEGVIFKCNANGANVGYDSLYLFVDTIGQKMIMGIQDTLSGFRAFITIHHPLKDFDLPMGKDTFGFVNANTSFGTLCLAEYGNFAMHINADKTVCGNFFWHNNANKLYVSQGQFANVPYKYY